MLDVEFWILDYELKKRFALSGAFHSLASKIASGHASYGCAGFSKLASARTAFNIQNSKLNIAPLHCAFNNGCQYALDRLDLVDEWIGHVSLEDLSIAG